MILRNLLAALTAAVVAFGSASAARAQNSWELTTRAWDKTKYYELLVGLSRAELQAWITDPIIVYAIREQNAAHNALTDRQIKRLDTRWRRGGAYGPILNDLIGRQASVILRDRREQSADLFNEIIVIDAFGMNVAISDPTTDYFQGDEAKFLETYPKGPGAVHVSEIGWDESVRRNQAQVSLSVTDPDTGAVIGVVTFGIDVINAMKLRT